MENIFKQNTVNVIVTVKIDLLKSENLRVVFAQLCNELQVYNFTMLYVREQYIKPNSLNLKILIT